LRPQDFKQHPPDFLVDDMRELTGVMATRSRPHPVTT
jgi:hypothetical protein